MSDKLAVVKFDICDSPPYDGTPVVLSIDEHLVFNPDPPDVAAYKSSMKPPRLPGRGKQTKARHIRRDFSVIEIGGTMALNTPEGSLCIENELAYMLEKLIGEPVDDNDPRIRTFAKIVLRAMVESEVVS